MECVREFYGTLNGGSVFGLIKDTKQGPWRNSSSDRSHLWHVHISFFRTYAENAKAIEGVIDVMKGVPWKQVESKPTPAPDVDTHTVVKGDTLWAIAKRYGTSIAAIKAMNGLRNDTIYPNQVLKVKAAKPAPATPARPSPAATELKRGTKGTRVSTLQKGLNRVFPLYSRLAVDGDFGPATERVVKEFQRRSNLTADGIVGPNTRRALARYGITV
jgi:murein L,D-transpeptidase YcbB/YkuD